MVFNSYTFIVFFAVVLFVHNLPFKWTFKKVHLLLASYLFYAVWNPPFILLLLFSTFIDFQVGKNLSTEQNPTKRKWWLAASLVGNLGPLAYFKYGEFMLENFVSLSSLAGFDFHPAAPDIILPVGISFYTFQTLSYSLDMYNRKYAPEKSFLDFALFVTFFPQLVAGPIVRPDELIPQFKSPVKATLLQFNHGMFLLTLGLFMKVVLADSLLAGPADAVFSAGKDMNAIDAWMGVLAFSGQIFFDFGGYSTCAIGIALCLGFTIRDNFFYPYAAIGFSDFWRRWHITLSTWLRDYLYIPLGGNRKGIIRTYINVMLTMLIGGLWHGANWTFVVWGGLHGLYLAVEKYIQDKRKAHSHEPGPHPHLKPNFAHAMLTFFLVNITWVFFRAQDFTTAWSLLKSMFLFGNAKELVLNYLDILKVSVVITGMIIVHWQMRHKKVLTVAESKPWWSVGLVWTFLLVMLILSQESTSSFIYFQF
ncbi:MAG: MBOAT family O-acyltransferase [Saprospiraceae bacterium]